MRAGLSHLRGDGESAGLEPGDLGGPCFRLAAVGVSVLRVSGNKKKTRRTWSFFDRCCAYLEEASRETAARETAAGETATGETTTGETTATESTGHTAGHSTVHLVHQFMHLAHQTLHFSGHLALLEACLEGVLGAALAGETRSLGSAEVARESVAVGSKCTRLSERSESAGAAACGGESAFRSGVSLGSAARSEAGAER